MQLFCLVTQRSFPLRGRRLKGKGREFSAGPRAMEDWEEERVLSFLAHPSRFSRAQNPLSLPFAQARLSHKQWKKKKNGMFLLVTLRLLSNLPISSTAPLLYFFHVSAVCFRKAFIALYVFIYHKFDDFIFFCFWWFPWKYWYFYLSLIPTSLLERNLFYHRNRKEKKNSSMFQQVVN